MPRPVTVRAIYEHLLAHYGLQRWWPADSAFEVIIGAILTQNTSWKNVEKAIANLRAAHLLTLRRLAKISTAELARLIRPAGYFNQKAKKLHAFLDYLSVNYQLDLNLLFQRPTRQLRRELLSIWGIGEETADSICLYAAQRPVFVVDAYTRRLFSRLGHVEEKVSYAQLQSFLTKRLPSDAQLFNEYHALIVTHAKETCRKQEPLCSRCVLRAGCAYGRLGDASAHSRAGPIPIP
jgi:endonuclease-3 related protein